MEKHGQDVHKRVHGRALAQGRPYAVRWATFRKSRVQQLMLTAAINGMDSGPLTKTTPSGVVKVVNPPRDLQLAKEVQHDDEALQQFHAQLWKRIDRYKRHKLDSKGDDEFLKAWPQEDHDIHHGILALDKSLRKAAKATIKQEELFSTPPLTPRTKKDQAEKEKRRSLFREQKRRSQLTIPN
uniref:Uncharacterized protein n=1 Tax=Alexandrium catenella TaxID=2925 RepID=A0A7S1PVT4_ALECA